MRWAPKNCQRGTPESEAGPRGPFLEGPGSPKVRQASTFDGKTRLILRFSFFALDGFWRVPRGSPERGAEQQEFRRGDQGRASISFWGPWGGPGVSRGTSPPFRRVAEEKYGGYAEGRRRGGRLRLLEPEEPRVNLKTPSTRWVRRIGDAARDRRTHGKRLRPEQGEFRNRRGPPGTDGKRQEPAGTSEE